MGFFNFIETFFFLSLGITFVLILLLVYHFKQRLTTLENKCDTVYEIITNLVKEVSNIRQIQIQHLSNTFSSNNIVPSFHNTEINGKIKVSDEDFEDDEEDDEEEDDDDEDEDEEEDDETPPLLTIEEEPLLNSTIKVINVDIGDIIEADIVETEVESENLDGEDNRLEPIELEDDEQIHVEKLNESAALENSELDNDSKENSRDVYNKMSVSELKALVITKGLSSDPSKKKKNELLKMLEAVEN
uniref:Rho termination factor N-terminal domain-containing protein n=1 Tax=viral metagenome TaxID=1070528 RepID=A0A6C0L6J0_9ZZZZ